MLELRHRLQNPLLLAVAVLCCVSPALADGPQRPRVGLVLSGGGARGTAHIGVLKVLEEMHIPVDAIAGTSMGAVVGGLYASGLSAAEIEKTMTSIDWQDAFQDRPSRADLAFRRKQDDQNFLVQFPLGLKGGKLLLPRGLIQGQKLHQTLRALTLPMVGRENFDRLPIPLRVVTADLETGEKVILGGGDLATAMRASISAPGVFAPVDVDGRLLVDGGIAENLPVDVARSMGVDVLIVVDVSFPLSSRKGLQSPLQVSNQMLAILIRRETERQRATLGPRDIVISPQLGDASSANFSLVKGAIEKGEAAARAMGPQLADLSLDEGDFKQYLAARHAARTGELPRVSYIKVEEGSERYARSIHATLDPLVGKPLDVARVENKVEELYGLGNFEVLDYRLVQTKTEEGQWGLRIRAQRKSWGPNYVRFGLNLQDDFEGNNSFNAAARFIVTEINALGAEWTSDVQLGESPRLFTEFYQPLNYGSRFFIAPHLDFQVRSVQVRDDNESIAEFRVRSFEAGLEVGREFGNWGELRAGVRRGSGKSRVRIGAPDLPESEFNTGQYFVRMAYDKLNNVNFPRRGQSMTLQWIAGREGLGDDNSSDRIDFDWLFARSRGRHTLIFWTTAGTTLDNENAAVEDYFPLGGFLNLSGLAPTSISGPHFGIARLIYYRQISRDGPGFLDVPVYAGLSLEAGNVWQERRDAGFGATKRDGSLFLGLDTLLGPLYLAAGFDDGGRTAFYLFLGRTF